MGQIKFYFSPYSRKSTRLALSDWVEGQYLGSSCRKSGYISTIQYRRRR